MNVPKKIFVIVIYFWFIAGYVYAQEVLQDKEQLVSLVERDPFSLSAELLKKTMSDKYVSFTGEGMGGFNLPKIEITGVMVVGDETRATARIETLGDVTLEPDDRIVFASSVSGKRRFSSFIIKEITPSELVILVEGGYEIHGRFR